MKKLQALEQEEKCRLYYYDESGFSLTPCLPYAWQPVGETLGLPAEAHSKRLNVLGFLSREHDFQYRTVEGRVVKETVIETFNQFVDALPGDRPVYVVLDNASTHTSKAFREAAVGWQERGVTLIYLPPYSPELNLIEILWRMVKYYRLPLSAYVSFEALKKEVVDTLNKYGSEYRITFS